MTTSIETAPIAATFNDKAGAGVHEKVFEMTKYLVRGRKVLVVGAGQGSFEYRLIEAGVPVSDIRSADISPRHHKISGIECQFANLNESVPFEDGSFQMVYATEVIEHLHNPKRLIQEAFRVLEVGGYLTITTPNPASLTQRLRFLLTGKLAWWSEEDYLGSGHIHPIFDWILERLHRGMFEQIRYDSQAYKFKFLPMPKWKIFAVNNIYIFRKLDHP